MGDSLHLYNDPPIDLRTYKLWHGQRPMAVAALRGASPQKYLVAANGTTVEDAGGRKYLDFRAGIANVLLGYGRSTIADAIAKQASTLPMACSIRHERPAAITVEYAERLAATAPDGLDRVRLTHMGSASVENALLMARQHFRNRGQHERVKILSLTGGFHGTTLMSMAASGDAQLHDMFAPMPPGFNYLPKPSAAGGLRAALVADASPDIQQLDRVLEAIEPSTVAAIIVEPVMGARVEALPKDYVAALRNRSDQHGFLLIFDEIVTGFGRTGDMWAADTYDITPDIMCLAKGVTSGYATLGATLATDDIYDSFNPPFTPHFANGSSTDGHPIACAAALAVLDIYDSEPILEVARTTSAHLAQTAGEMADDSPLAGDLRSAGMLVGVDIVDPHTGNRAASATMNTIRNWCEDHGLLIQCSENVVFFQPPLTVTPEECSTAVAIVADSLHAASPT